VEQYAHREGLHPKASVERFIRTFQRHTILSPEAPVHRNLLVSTLVGNLSTIKRQKQNKIVE
jgi:hypothetical protein